MTAVTVTATAVRPLDGCVTRGNKEAAAAMSVGDLVRIGSDGKLYEADASTLAGVKGLLGIVLSGHKKNKSGTIAAGETCTIAVFGPVAGFTSLAEQTIHYVSNTAGAIDNAAGTFSRAVGYPESSEVFFLFPDAGDPGS